MERQGSRSAALTLAAPAGLLTSSTALQHRQHAGWTSSNRRMQPLCSVLSLPLRDTKDLIASKISKEKERDSVCPCTQWHSALLQEMCVFIARERVMQQS